MILKSVSHRTGVRAGVDLKAVCDSIFIEDIVKLTGVDAQTVLVAHVDGNGAVLLRGRMGEGRGDALVLDPGSKTANWLGRVKGFTEVNP